MVKLYSYWRSTTSYRVRIALNLKRVAYETIPVDLVAGEHKADSYVALNPIDGVPTLAINDGAAIVQSMAILDWLEAAHPSPPLLPSEPFAAAQVKAAAMVIACDVHPVNNLKVVAKLRAMNHSEDEIVAWMNDWMTRGFSAFEALTDPRARFCFGDAPGLADICLVAQLYNAHRWRCDLRPFERLTAIEARCLALPAFEDARPERQPDAIH